MKRRGGALYLSLEDRELTSCTLEEEGSSLYKQELFGSQHLSSCQWLFYRSEFNEVDFNTGQNVD